MQKATLKLFRVTTHFSVTSCSVEKNYSIFVVLVTHIVDIYQEGRVYN